MSDRDVMQMALEALELEATRTPIPETAAAIAALRACLAEPEPEPVAWRVMLPDGYQFVYDERMLRVIDESIHATRQPLYTTPPTRRPLTDEEADALWRTTSFRGNGGQRCWFVEGIRVAERAHKITGGNDE